MQNNTEINGGYLEADENAVSLVCVHFSLDFLVDISWMKCKQSDITSQPFKILLSAKFH